MQRPPLADASNADIDSPYSDAAAAGNNALPDVEAIRTVVHALVDALAPAQLQCLWAVLAPYLAPEAPWDC